MAYLENVTHFFKFLIDNNNSSYEVYNYADKPDLTMNQLVQMISNGSQQPVRNLSIPYPLAYVGGRVLDVLSIFTKKKYIASADRIRKFCANTRFSNDKMQRTGFVPPCSLEEGLQKTIAQFRQQ